MARSSRSVRSSRTGALVGIAATTMLLACNGILGLDEFSAVVCTGGRCDGGVDGSTNDAPSDVTVDALGTAPVSWARWKMPNYPQDVLDAGAGSDANNVVTYAATPSGDVLDNVSKLLWVEPAIVGGKSFADAKTACPSGARLPSRIELVSLLDLSRTPTVAAIFGSTQPATYWTSSEVRPYTTGIPSHWVVDFSGGSVRKLPDSSTALVRCIKDAR